MAIEPKKEADKVKLYGGMEYWSKVIITMDKKLETISKNYGFGELGLTIVIHNGKIMYSLFTDKIKLKEEFVDK